MKATMTVQMDNAAFADDPMELVRILRELADKLEKNGGITERFVVMDVNGNKVGSLDITDYIRDHVPCRKVEYDTSFFGGDYSGVGNVVYIPNDDDVDIREMFQRMTGIDPIHIVHIPLDETYTIDGELLELLD